MSKEPGAPKRTLSLKEKAKERLAGFTNLNRGKSKSIEVQSEQKTGDAGGAGGNTTTSRPRSWLAEIEGHVFENPLSWDNLDIPEGLQNTLNSAGSGQNTDSRAGMEDESNGNTEVRTPIERKRSRSRSKPHGTMDYEVTQRDTLNSIAAKFDTTPSELVKLNKLILRTIIPGQVLYVPVKDAESSEPNSPSGSPTEEKQQALPTAPASETSKNGLQATRPRSPSSPANISPTLGRRYLFAGKEIPLVQHIDKLVSKGPGLAARQSPETLKMEPSGPNVPHALSEEEARTLDEECLERFIKVNVKYITDGQGVVSGVLLVTPNAIMFDPNVSDALVLEHGADAYGMIAPMETIISAAIYHDIAAMKLSSSKKEPSSPTETEPKHHEVYHSVDSAATDKNKTQNTTDSSLEKPDSQSDKVPPEGTENSQSEAAAHRDNADSVQIEVKSTDTGVTDQTSDLSQAVTMVTLVENQNIDVAEVSDVTHHKVMTEVTTVDAEVVSTAVAVETTTAAATKEQKAAPVSVSSGQTLDLPHLELTPGGKEAGSDGGSVESGIAEMHDERSPMEEEGATKSPHSATSLTPHMQIGNITYFQYDDNVNQEKLSGAVEPQAGEGGDKAKDVTDGDADPNAAQQKNIIRRTIGSLTSLTGTPNFSSIVDFSSGLFTRSQDERGRVKDVSEVDLAAPPKSAKSEPNLTDSQKKTSVSEKKQLDISVESVIKLDDKPELFQSLDELIPKPATLFEDPPLYLCLRVGKPINKKVSKTCPIESYSKRRKKPEYWFSVPKERVDHLYAFFVQWSPDIYGGTDEIDPKERGFVVIDDKEEEELDIVDEHFTGSRLIKQVSKDWEIVKVEEARRRLSLAEDESLPLPDMNNESTILQEEHIRKLNKHLPPRTVGYPWSLIYSTDKHGFSLNSLYRLMPGVDSPILLVVKDTQNNVFGAMVSCALRVSDHFYGTGESFLFTFYPEFKKFDWTGENNFFVKGNLNSLSIGAGQGVYGLWVDGDIYHGHTQKCATYDNDTLSAKEDFVVKGLEAWGFI